MTPPFVGVHPLMMDWSVALALGLAIACAAVERLDADHRDRVVFVLGEKDRPTQKQLKQRREIIVKLRQLAFGPPKGVLLFKRSFDKSSKSGGRLGTICARRPAGRQRPHFQPRLHHRSGVYAAIQGAERCLLQL
jgi:hypothetical protein